ncbi:hypothetical protein QQ045_010237 [Rhodiola kirilowii]
MSTENGTISIQFSDGNFELKELQKLEGHTDRVWSVTWSTVAASPSFASCSGDKTVRICQMDSNTGLFHCKARSGAKHYGFDFVEWCVC